MVIVITGPTCVGKTKLSIELAKKLNGEVINADSTQVYKNLDIATAKITEEEKENISHHLFDIKDITEDYTVCDYQKGARLKINEILSRGKVPIMVGGTGLYIKAALYDYEFEPEEKELLNDYNGLTNAELYDRLTKLDSNHNIHINNRKRLVRALNYITSTNKKYSEKEKTDKLLYNTVFIGLTTNRSILYDKINNRVDKMIKLGLLEEAKKIYDSNVRTKAVMTPIGYKELFDYFEGNKSLDECLDVIKQKSRNYAKRQYTWFNHQMKINWFNVDYDNFNNTIDAVLNYLDNLPK